ncbi:hypothetical protein DFH06DRAFT_1484628 [Mycena polygramma]|nr:hypothetical protein DFH06DRAFT_1484628 [Mycena polygramma]
MSTAKMSHQTARALRTVHSSSVARAAAMEATFGMSPTVDIFDAPVRLRQVSASQRPVPPLSPHTMKPRAPTQPRTSLPNPLVFAGPAGRRPVPGTHHDHELALLHSPRHADGGSKPVVTMFDGPAHSGGRPLSTASGSSSSRGGHGAKSTSPATGKKISHLALSAAAATAVTLAVAQS